MANIECLFKDHRFEWYDKPEEIKIWFIRIKYHTRIWRCVQCGCFEYPVVKACYFPGKMVGEK